MIPFETERQGKSTQAEVEALVMRDTSRKVVAQVLPRKPALRAYYQVGLVPCSFLGDERRAKTLASCALQVYADWWYAWTLTHYVGTHRDIFIALKKGLRVG